MVVLLGTAATVIAVGVMNLFLLRLGREWLLPAAYASAAAVHLLLAVLLARSALPLFAATSMAAFAVAALIVWPAVRAEPRASGGH